MGTSISDAKKGKIKNLARIFIFKVVLAVTKVINVTEAFPHAGYKRSLQ